MSKINKNGKQHVSERCKKKKGGKMPSAFVEDIFDDNGHVSSLTTFSDIKVIPKNTKIGVMIVGLAGNNGSSFEASLLAHKHDISWNSRTGIKRPLFLGSLSQVGTAYVGRKLNGAKVYKPIKSLSDFVEPTNIIVGGWDISNRALVHSLEENQVFEPTFITKIKDLQTEQRAPLRSIFYPDFVAKNQSDRANNLIPGNHACREHLEIIRRDIRNFKRVNNVEQVIVIFSATTERCMHLQTGVHYRADNLIAGVHGNCAEISPSLMFGIATVLEGSIFLNGGPQNTIVPGLVDLACKHRTFVGGSDFKTGQTKLKSVLADFWTSAGFRLRSVVSYNHLGNNDGRNLSEREQFLSKEKSKSTLLEQITRTNEILFPPGSKGPDHEIVIKYAPSTGDHKRAIDEYVADICMEEQQSLVVYNICPDSLLCVPLMLDLAVFADWLSRVRLKKPSSNIWETLETTQPLLAYFFKVTSPDSSSSLFEQRLALVNMVTNAFISRHRARL